MDDRMLGNEVKVKETVRTRTSSDNPGKHNQTHADNIWERV